jgi:hypothetical protein
MSSPADVNITINPSPKQMKSPSSVQSMKSVKSHQQILQKAFSLGKISEIKNEEKDEEKQEKQDKQEEKTDKLEEKDAEHEDSTETESSGTDPLDSLTPAAFQYRQVDEMLKDAFNYKESNNSMICDIIAMYLKGQKILYTEAKTLCEQRLNLLMMPTICITAICTVISLVLKDWEYGSTVVSSLNGLNFFFLTLINYLKLDAKAEAHRVAAYKFDKLQSKLEFNSGKILFVVGESKILPQLINDTEKDVREIKETNQFILPESIRYNYPRLNNINVFSEVKKIQYKETVLINKLKDTLNDHVDVQLHLQEEESAKDLKKLEELEQLKRDLTNHIINIKNEYLDIDGQFEKEMKQQREKLAKRYQLCNCLKT